MLRRALCVVVLVTFTLATVALADPPTVAIEQQATLATTGVEVTVVVNCGDGPSMAEVEVQVRQGEAAFTSFAFPFESTGDRQEITILVFGAFTAGEASATAFLACGTMLSGLQLGAIIRISE
jgi:hypothetical protein